jgi:putrescine transport system ATP-binding protein
MKIVLRTAAVDKSFGNVKAVDGISLDVFENECLVLLGASGCGKTTLLRLMAGLETCDTGRIFIDDADVTATPPYARPVNMMFQSYALFPHMTVAANVAFGLRQEGVRGAELDARVKEALGIVELTGLEDRKPDQLSGGQRQRVALARCLAKRPRVLLLDEPMAALDKQLRERTQLELMALRKRLGITFIIVTHDQSEAMTMADRVAVMHAGRILQLAVPRALYERPASRRVAQFFGDINLWDGVAQDGGIFVPSLNMNIPTTDALPAGGTNVGVALRPERIDLLGNNTGIAGNVEQVVYLGTASTYFIKTDGGVVVRAVQQNSAGAPVFAVGERVHLSWSPDAVTVLTQ